MEKTGRIQSIDRTLMVLNCFSEHQTELRLSEIAQEIGLNKSTAHGILNTLKYHGLISQDEESHKYRLGLRLMELGSRAANSLNIIQFAGPKIRKLCSEIEETVHLGTLDGEEMVYIDKIESWQSMRIASSVGARLPAYGTGMGKAIMAFLSEEELMKSIPAVFRPFTPNTIVNMEDLLEELERIREKGYAIDNEEHSIGLRCVAAPIFNHEGKVKYSISVSGPGVRMSEGKMDTIILLVREACRDISEKMGYKGDHKGVSGW